MSVTFARRSAREAERRPLDRAGRGLGVAPAPHRARLDDEGQRRAAEPARAGTRRRRRPAPAGWRASALKTAWTISLGLPLMSSSDVGVHQQRDEKDAAEDRHREQQLERRFGDELRGDQRPVGRGDQRAALERRLQSRGLRHRTGPVYLCGILLYECPASCRGNDRSAGAGCSRPARSPRRSCSRPALSPSCGGSASTDGAAAGRIEARVQRRLRGDDADAVRGRVAGRREPGRAARPRPRGRRAARRSSICCATRGVAAAAIATSPITIYDARRHRPRLGRPPVRSSRRIASTSAADFFVTPLPARAAAGLHQADSRRPERGASVRSPRRTSSRRRRPRSGVDPARLHAAESDRAGGPAHALRGRRRRRAARGRFSSAAPDGDAVAEASIALADIHQAQRGVARDGRRPGAGGARADLPALDRPAARPARRRRGSPRTFVRRARRPPRLLLIAGAGVLLDLDFADRRRSPPACPGR